MWSKIKNLPNINGKLYIYAEQSGVLAITSDLDKVYYSVYLDGVEPTAKGLFVTPYPVVNDFENYGLFLNRVNVGDYGVCVNEALPSIKSFEVVTSKHETTCVDIPYLLYKGMTRRLNNIIIDCKTQTKPHNSVILISAYKSTAEFAATDNKTICVFRNIPVTSTTDDEIQYFLDKYMVTASLNFDADTITISNIKDSDNPAGEYRLQLVCGDYLFVEKQSISSYPIYTNVLNHYQNRTPLPLTLCPIHIESIKNITPYKVDDDCDMIKLSSLMDVICPEPDANTSEAVFNKAYIQKVFDYLASPNYSIITGSDKEQLQLSCKWGKTQEYTQDICLMPINPYSLIVKELSKDFPKTDEPVSSCNIKALKNLI